jgi:hypothetical protein
VRPLRPAVRREIFKISHPPIDGPPIGGYSKGVEMREPKGRKEMAKRTKKIEVWVVMDAEGNVNVDTNKDDAIANFSGEVHVTVAKVMVEVTMPQVVELAAAVTTSEELELA